MASGGEQPLTELRRLSESLGNPGAAALYTAARRAKLNVTKKQVSEFARDKPEKQQFGAPQRATGKTISEDDNRMQMDLIEVPNQPAGDWRYFLAVINVFDRFLYVRPLKTKEPAVVSKALVSILNSAQEQGRKLPDIMSSDNGLEFNNAEVKKVLSKKGIVQKFKDVGDLNALGLLDRTIGLLKRRLAENHTATNSKRGSWAINLQAAVNALNKTPKPEVLHGAAPVDVRDDPEVRFLLLQEQARNLKKNDAQNAAKEAQLKTTGTFRPPVAVTKFKRNFQATYSDPQEVHKIKAGRVHTKTGESYPLKQIRIVRAVDKDGVRTLATLERALKKSMQSNKRGTSSS